MTPQELRIAVAKDVLERVVPDKSVQVATLDYLNGSTEDGQAKVCQVCAVGGMVLSCLENRRLAAELGHHKTLSDAINPLFVGDFVYLTERVLRGTFSKEQLGLIEAAFEGNFSGYWGDPSFTIRDDVYYNDIVWAVDVDEDDDADRLSDDDRKHFEDLKRAVAFSERFERSYAGDAEDADYYRALLAAIMHNVIQNEGEFRP